MTRQFVLGWEEWLALPELGLPAIKAKIDTGARTSALQADNIEIVGIGAEAKVRFTIRPVPGRESIAITALADLVDQREVVSSNGERELRYVVRTTAVMGDRRWSIDISLTNRETMTYRMLLGRQGLQSDMMIDPSRSFCQSRLSHRDYGATIAAEAGEAGDSESASDDEAATLRPGPFTIGLLTRRPDNASVRRIVRTAERRGHRVIIIDRTRLSLYIATADPAIFLDGRQLEPIDALVVRSGRGLNPFSLAAIRQMALLQTYCINGADALQRTFDPLARRQTLARHGLIVPEVAVSHADLLKTGRSDTHVLADTGAHLADGALLRIAVVGGRPLAAVERTAATALEPDGEWRMVETIAPGTLAEARPIAARAARALDLGLASVDIAVSRAGPLVLDVSPNPPMADMERMTGSGLTDALLVHIEMELRGRGRIPRGSSSGATATR